MHSEPSDDELANRLRQGDSAALSEFAQRHRGALAGYVNRRLGDALRAKVDADDIIQETLASAFRLLLSNPPVGYEPFGWLCHLADQRIVDAYRHHVRSQKRSASREVRPAASSPDASRMSFSQMLAASITSPSQACVRDERQQRLDVAIGHLPAEQQEALRLHFLQGLSSREIASRLGKNDVAVRVMLSRSIRRLRDTLADSQTRIPGPNV